jgi:hypothetical protein
MKKDFDYLKWHLHIVLTFGDYAVLYDYIEDKKAHSVHIENYKKTFERNNIEGGHKFEGKIKQYHNGISLSMMKKSLSTYSNQMVVIFSIYIENIIKEFFTNLFIIHPIKMYDYLPDNNSLNLTGYVSFKKVIENDSKESLLLSLAEQSAIIISKGGIESVLKKFINLTNHNLPKDLLIEIIEMIDLRNKIVHEFYKENLSLEKIDFYSKLTLEFLEEVKKAAKKNKVVIHE